MLNSCAPGVVVCNIDNGFGAGVFAARVARRAGDQQQSARRVNPRGPEEP
jgi:NCAIR mutase (PurE)-related protein